MKKSFSLLFLLVAIIVIWTACQHEVINANANLNTDSIVVVIPPTNGGSTNGNTSPSVSDTVCFNSEVLPLYINYCGSAGCHNETSHRDGVITTSYGYIMNGIDRKSVV